jgi:hypothetical protein
MRLVVGVAVVAATGLSVVVAVTAPSVAVAATGLSVAVAVTGRSVAVAAAAAVGGTARLVRPAAARRLTCRSMTRLRSRPWARPVACPSCLPACPSSLWRLLVMMHDGSPFSWRSS